MSRLALVALSFFLMTSTSLFAGDPGAPPPKSEPVLADPASFGPEVRTAETNATRPADHTEKVAQGEYKPLSLWSKLKLGSVYYTNPELAKRIQVVYSFDPASIQSSSDSDSARALFTKGQIAVGIPVGDSKLVKVVQSDSFVSDNPQDFDHFIDKAKREGLSLVTAEASLAHQDPEKVLYTYTKGGSGIAQMQ